jgi:hypothetical protein
MTNSAKANNKSKRLINTSQKIKGIVPILIAVLITALIVGGGVYLWQRAKLQSIEQDYKNQIEDLKDRITKFQQVEENNRFSDDGQNDDNQGDVDNQDNSASDSGGSADNGSNTNNEDNTGDQTDSQTKLGYVKNVYVENSKRYIDIDYIQWLDYEECEARDISAPDGYCVVNENDSIEEVEVADDVEIRMQTLSYRSDGNYNRREQISFDEFKELFAVDSESHLQEVPYNVEIKDNAIVEIIEQYVP